MREYTVHQQLLCANSPFFTSAFEKDWKEGQVKNTVQEKPTTVNLASDAGIEALYFASPQEHSDLVHCLLCETRINVNPMVNNRQIDPLFTATTGQEEVVRLHLRIGLAEIDSKYNDYGATSLMQASTRGHEKIAGSINGSASGTLKED